MAAQRYLCPISQGICYIIQQKGIKVTDGIKANNQLILKEGDYIG